MRLLHVTDLHFREPWYDWVRSQAGAFDGVCVSGDFVDLFAVERTPYGTQWLGVPPGHAMERPTIFVAHSPPAGTLAARSAEYADPEAAPEWLGKVSGWYLTGHIHAPARWWDRQGELLILNPGCDFSAEIPNHIVLDFGIGRASYFVRSELADTIETWKLPQNPHAAGSDPASSGSAADPNPAR